MIGTTTTVAGITMSLLLILAVGSCYKDDSQPAGCDDCGGAICIKDNVTIQGKWPGWCSQPDPTCMYVANSDKGISPVRGWRPSENMVGSGMRLLFADPLTTSLPIVYLGTPTLEPWLAYHGWFLYGRAITPGELSFDSSLGKYVSQPVWGWPVTGTHVYRIPGREIRVQIDSLPTGDQCRSVQDVTVATADLQPGYSLPDSSWTLSLVRSDRKSVTTVVSDFAQKNIRRVFGGEFTTTTFLYVSWPRENYPEETSRPNWYFLSASAATAFKGSGELRYQVPNLARGDVGAVVSNSLCDGLMGEALTTDTSAKEYTFSLNVPSLQAEFYYSDLKGDFYRYAEKYDVAYNCTYLNVEIYLEY